MKAIHPSTVPRPTTPARKLPSIVPHLPTSNEMRFIMPKPGGAKLATLLTEATRFSPALSGTGMTLRRLMLSAGDCIPVHHHTVRSKLYIQLSGAIKVYIWLKGWDQRPDEFIVDSSNIADGKEFFVVPAGCPHAIIYLVKSSISGECVTLVVSSPENSTDISWEADAEKLCTNAHLNKG